MRHSLATAALACILAATPARADEGLQHFLAQAVTSTREQAQLPALAAVIEINGRIEAEAVVGVRALGHRERATLADRWHLGSCTKAFTSTVVARLVERNLMSFDDTLDRAFPQL